MQIANQYGVAYQSSVAKKSQLGQTKVDALEQINPTSVGINSNAINSITRPDVDGQSQQPKPKQIDPQSSPVSVSNSSEFNFATAASAGANKQTIYDKPSGANSFAINSYQQVVNGPKREEIQRLVGIDTFA